MGRPKLFRHEVQSPLGMRLDDFMREHKIKNTDMCAATGFTTCHVSKWRGGYGCPKIDAIQQIVRAFDVDPDELYWLIMGHDYGQM